MKSRCSPLRYGFSSCLRNAGAVLGPVWLDFVRRRNAINILIPDCATMGTRVGDETPGNSRRNDLTTLVKRHIALRHSQHRSQLLLGHAQSRADDFDGVHASIIALLFNTTSSSACCAN